MFDTDINYDFDEILDGTILSDGCLHIQKNAINARFSISLKPESKEWINLLKEQFELENIKCWSKEYTRKTGISSINLTTQINTYLTELHKRWYKNGKKRIKQ